MGAKIAIYAGTFDIFTNGHYDVLQRSLKIFDKVILLVARPPAKNLLFDADQRVEMLERLFKGNERVIVDGYNGLVVNYAQERGITSLIRGLRPTGDFENEYQIASMNRRLNSNVEVVFFMTGGENYFVSSTLIREVLINGGDTSPFVPEAIHQYLKENYKGKRE